MTRLMLDTGIRVGECTQLKPENIDFHNRSILIINPKNHRDRYVFFSGRLSTDLRRRLHDHDRFSDSAYLFPTTRGNMIDANVFEKSLKKVGAESWSSGYTVASVTE
ncbi:tyrosine-type recombinase/integrase [Domibacillus sp.]|uniref:tyrosine-type recombinase/integrase n=1 Tax=Domibacillus sp. TaxID=1969783 RepID=UPI002811D89A|nr:tyrosine-type recombinase/integrase [Domibacillus sp.]